MSDGNIKFPPGRRREAPKFEPPPWERKKFEELAKTREEPEPVTAQEAPPETTARREPNKGAREVTEEQMALLLSGLRAEEPPASQAYVMVSMVTGIILAVIGLAVTTWGVVVLMTAQTPGPTTLVLLLGLLVPGLGFLGGGVWLVINSLRRQGVL